MYLHLPAINGQVAAQAAIGEELRQIARLAQDQAFRRDLVELVTQPSPSNQTGSVRRQEDPWVRNSPEYSPEERPRKRPPSQLPRSSLTASPDPGRDDGGFLRLPLVDIRV
jgi:hypothetical protein